MRCAKAQKYISDHTDKLLNREQVQALEQHLKGCAACSELLNEMRMIAEEAKEMESVLPSENLWSAIESHITRSDRKGRNWLSGVGQSFRFSFYSRELAFSMTRSNA